MSRSFKVKIIRATDIEEALPGDPYVKAWLVSEKADSKPVKLHKTRAVKETVDPEWHEEFEVTIPASDRELFYDYPIKFEVYDRDVLGKSRLSGATFNFGYHWTAALPVNEEIPIKLPLEKRTLCFKGALYISVTLTNKGHSSFEDHAACDLPVPQDFLRVRFKTPYTLGTVLLPKYFLAQSKKDAAGTAYPLYATSKTLEGGNMSILLTEETCALHTLKEASSKITREVAFVLGVLKADNAWQWCGPTETFKIDEENSGLTVSYRTTSNEGEVFTTKYFFYLLGTRQFYTLTFNVTKKPVGAEMTPEQWEAFTKETIAEAKTTILNAVMESLKLYPIATYNAAEVTAPDRDRRIAE